MNMNWIDWSIVAGLSVFIVSLIFIANKYTKSVADYLVANRCAGRYVLSVAQGIAGLGAITVMAQWEMFYEAGFTTQWWANMLLPIAMIIAITGYVAYRYRQTRAMTLAQFFEIRYNKSFRVFAGIVAFLCGIINFGLFPAVGSRFFIYFGGLPEATVLPIINIEVSTFAFVMFILLAVSVFFTWMGGQIAIIMTDFFQGFFCNIVYVAILIFIFIKVDWSQISQALLSAPEGQSPVNPFKGGQLENFNVWYFVIGGFGAFYSMMAWQGSQAYFCSAKSPHEAKMANILATWKSLAISLLMIMLPIVAYTIMHHADFSELAGSIKAVLATIDNESVQGQMTVPVALTKFLPTGLRGALFAVVLAAFVSTHDTSLHSWGSIFIQDVIMPFRKKPFTPKQHIFWLRASVLFVAIFIFMFSLLYKQTQNIYMFFALTGSIFLGGAGSCIVGGLYWKKGTTRGAFGALITGATLAAGTFIVRHYWNDWYGHDFPVNSQMMYLFSMLSSLTVYITLSLLENKTFNLDRMLHHGKYAIEDDTKRILAEETQLKKKSWFQWFTQKTGLSKEFTLADKILFYATIVWSLGWFLIFMAGTIYHIYFGTTDEGWMTYWRYWTMFMLVLGTAVIIWMLVGGLYDLKDMFHRLRTAKRNDADDGTVVDHHNLDEEFIEEADENSQNQINK